MGWRGKRLRVRDRHRQAMTLCGMGRLRLEPALSRMGGDR